MPPFSSLKSEILAPKRPPIPQNCLHVPDTMQSEYVRNGCLIQLCLPVETEVLIPVDDSVWLFGQCWRYEITAGCIGHMRPQGSIRLSSRSNDSKSRSMSRANETCVQLSIGQ